MSVTIYLLICAISFTLTIMYVKSFKFSVGSIHWLYRLIILIYTMLHWRQLVSHETNRLIAVLVGKYAGNPLYKGDIIFNYSFVTNIQCFYPDYYLNNASLPGFRWLRPLYQPSLFSTWFKANWLHSGNTSTIISTWSTVTKIVPAIYNFHFPHSSRRGYIFNGRFMIFLGVGRR